MTEVEMTPERQDIIDRKAILTAKVQELERQIAHVRVDMKHVTLDCKHPAAYNYTVMGDPSRRCPDCGKAFY